MATYSSRGLARPGCVSLGLRSGLLLGSGGGSLLSGALRGTLRGGLLCLFSLVALTGGGLLRRILGGSSLLL